MSTDPIGNHAFNAYAMVDTATKGEHVGGSYDNISAVTIACAAYNAKQNYNPTTTYLIVVFDSTDTPIAFVGRVEEGVGSPLE